MIPELGHGLLVFALVVTVAQAVLPLAGAATARQRLMVLATPAAVIQAALVLAAFLILTYAYLVSDFSVRNVALNSHTLKPPIYKLSGVWGNHEGSLLLWILILSLFGAALAVFGRTAVLSLKARTLGVQALVAAGFLLFLLTTSNPFERMNPLPTEGLGLNPLLQDPGLAMHPPLLYGGYVGLSIVFSMAVAALLEGRLDRAWARQLHLWCLAAWTLLTAGIALGSWWAYYELGWGGWWAWDPVENASFMPWLVATALLHSVAVAAKTGGLKGWTILLAILGFSLSLVGTFLVRSGILTSVHAFAIDPGRGVFILVLLTIATGGGLALFAWRAPKMEEGQLFRPISREGALLLNNLLLATTAGTVLLGTLYPLFLESLDGSRISVGPPYFATTFVPLMVPLICAVGVGPMLAWRRGDLAAAFDRLKFAFAIALAPVVLVAVLTREETISGMLGLGLAAWLGAATLLQLLRRTAGGRPGKSPGPLARLSTNILAATRSGAGAHTMTRAGTQAGTQDEARLREGIPRPAWAMILAHLGLAIVVAGVTGASLWQTERIVLLKPGERTEIAGYSVTFGGVREVPGPNYTALRASLTAQRGDKTIRLAPETRYYPVARSTTTEAAIHATPGSDLYAVLGKPDNGGWVVRLYHKPLIAWLWAGAALMVFGGFAGLAEGVRAIRRRTARTARTA